MEIEKTNGNHASNNNTDNEEFPPNQNASEAIKQTFQNCVFLIKDTDDDTIQFTQTCDFHITTKRFMLRLTPQTPISNNNLSYNIWGEYYNCLSHGTSGNKLVLLLGDAVLNEKMENGYEPEDSECESQIPKIEKEFSEWCNDNTNAEEDIFIELKRDYSLEIDLGEVEINDVFKLFRECSDMNEDPEEVRGNGAGSLFDMVRNQAGDGDDDAYVGGFDMSGFYTSENVDMFEKEQGVSLENMNLPFTVMAEQEDDDDEDSEEDEDCMREEK